MKRLLLLLIAAVIVLSGARSASAYPLETAVCVWNMDNNEDDNGPPYSNLDYFANADVTGTGIDGTEHFDGWAIVSEAESWTEFTPPHELVPSGPVSILVRVKMAVFANPIDAIAGIYDADCGTTVPSYAIEFHSGDPTFAVCAAGGSVRTTVSLGQVANVDTWYDILGVFDPVADELRLFVLDSATGSQVGSASVPVAFDSLIAYSLSEIEVFCSPCTGLGTISGGFVELAAIWMSVVEPPLGGAVSITETDDSTDVGEEGPTSDTYTVVLGSEPTDSVIITVNPDGQTEVNSSGAGNPIDLTFLIGNWDTAQTVTVTAIDDMIDEGSHTSIIQHSASSSDPNYNNIYIPSVVANIADNDHRSVTITETGGSTDVNEEGPTSDTYTIVLDSQPDDPVVITIDPDEETQVNGSGAGNPNDLTFTIANWATPQTVTVTAIDDAYEEGPETSAITHAAASGDPLYTGIYISPVIVKVSDNDRLGDLIRDGYINWMDLMTLTQQWLNECFAHDWCGGADLTALIGITENPGTVDFADFAIFADLWLDKGVVLITEFMAINNSTLFDEDGDDSDWIEIYNRGPVPVDLDGWYLTDDQDNLTKWRFPGVILDPYDYLVVFASGENRAVPGSQLHTNFNLDGGGEYLALVEPDGKSVLHSYSPEYPKQYGDVSYGRGIDGYGYLEQPTPGQANGQTYDGVVADTTFSVDRGFYDAPFQVEITTDTPGATIHYTLTYIDASSDRGKEPNETTGQVYTGPITINQTACLRAIAFKPGWLSTNVDTQTYILLDDVLTQAAGGGTPPGWPGDWGNNDVDYGMDPDIVTDPVWGPQMKDSLRALPTISIVTDMDNLFDPDIGIYANPYRRYREWERPCSMELIHPDGTAGFQIDCGIRIRGGSSRDGSNPKHSLRFFFRGEYGPTRLRYPLFGDEGADWYDHIDLRTASDHSWAWGGSSMFSFLHDVFSRDTQRDTGQEYTRSRYYHTYINGMYWGVYQSMEKPDDSYGESYLGGDRDDYDAIKVSRCEAYCLYEIFTIYATSGNLDAYGRLWVAAMAGFATDEAYWYVMGCNPDGTRNPAYEILVDLDNLIDMMLVVFYTGNWDEPLSGFLGNELPNNIWALGNRNGGDGFMYFTHDNENTLDDCEDYPGACDRTGPFAEASPEFKHFNPQLLHQELMVHPEYRMRFADRTHRHFFNNGALTDDVSIARLNERVDEIDLAIIAESARWGDAQVSTPRDHDDWASAVSDVLDFFPGRNSVVLDQIKGDALYPNVAAPSFNQHGGEIPPGFELVINNPHGSGTLYYTTDGNDPRLIGDAVAPSALTYSPPLYLDQSTHVKARVLDGDWSALNEAIFAVGSVKDNIRITEIMYHPQDTNDPNDPNTEFIELTNIGESVINLNFVRFTDGIDFTFGFLELGPDEYTVVVKDISVFEDKYGTSINIAGQYDGRLNNAGENIQLRDPNNAIILEFDYEDDWYPITDGKGFSLNIIDACDPNLEHWDRKQYWRPSSDVNGTPGAYDSGAIYNPDDIVINELLAHSPFGSPDWIELHNTTDHTINIGGWFLSDDNDDFKKYEIGTGTSIPSGGYIVFYEDVNFGTLADPGCHTPFALSENGETAYLCSGLGGELTGYSEEEEFGASAKNVSFGRYITSTGRADFVAMSSTTPGSANSYPKVGPIVITEIMYHPQSVSDAEYVELYNKTGSKVYLFDAEGNPWQFTDGGGIDYLFPSDANIPAYSYALLVKSKGSFETEGYPAVPGGVQIFEWGGGKLDNAGEQIMIGMPGDLDGGIRQYISIETIKYDDEPPWLTEPDGSGVSLNRIDINSYGNDPNNWQIGSPSPGDSWIPWIPPLPWTELTYDNFEGGWGNFTDGGTDCSLYNGGAYAHQGSSAADIQDDTGIDASFFHASGIDVDTPGYTQIKVEFWFIGISMENGEDFFVEYSDDGGSSWYIVADYDAGDEFINGLFYYEEVIIEESGYTFPSNMKIRFRCDANGNSDDVYIDEVRVSAR